MDLINNQNNNNNNDLINKRQYNFCVSLISQLIEEIEFETSKNSNQNNNNNNKILFNIFSLLKFQLKLFQELFVVQSRPMYDIVQYQEIQNIFEKGKGFIKKNLKQILSYSKAILEKKSSKTILDNHINLTSSSQNIIGSKNSFNKKLYNTKTFNNYIKNDERKLANENIMTTITKNNEFQNSSNSISSIQISNKNKLKKNLTIMKNKYQNFNIYKKTKKKGIDKNKFHKYYITTESKYSEGNLKKSNSKICINPNSTKNISGQRISVNQIKLSTNDNSKETNKINDSNKDKKNYLTNHLLQNKIIDENPVRKVKNIIINAKSLSSLNIPSVSIFIVACGIVFVSSFVSVPSSLFPSIVTLLRTGFIPCSSSVYMKSLYVILYISDELSDDVSMSFAIVWDGNVCSGDIISSMFFALVFLLSSI